MKTEKEKPILRFEMAYNNDLFNGRERMMIKGLIGNPDKYPNEQHESEQAFIRCNRCKGIFFWDSIIAVRYGIEEYQINIYCINCFEKEYPSWKRFFIRHFNYFKNKYNKIERCPISPRKEFNLQHIYDQEPRVFGVPIIYGKNERYKK